MKWKGEKVAKEVYQLLCQRVGVVRFGSWHLITVGIIHNLLYENNPDFSFMFYDGDLNQGWFQHTLFSDRIIIRVVRYNKSTRVYQVMWREGRIDEMEETLDPVAN